MEPKSAEARLAQLHQAFKGYTTFQMLTIGAELQLFVQLGKAASGLTPKELAAQLELHEPYVRVWCETAYGADFLDYDDAADRFRLGEALHTPLAQPGDPAYQGDFFRLFGSYFSQELLDLPELFRSGGLSDSRERRREFTALLKGRGTARGMLFDSAVLPRIDGLPDRMSAGLHLLDVGCGAGTFMLHLAERYPRCSFHGVDADGHAVEVAAQGIAEAGLGERVRVEQLAGNELNFDQRFDVATLNLVLHEIDFPTRNEAMTRVHRALKKPAILSIIDFPYPSRMEEFRDPSFAMGVIDQFYEVAWGSRHQNWEEIQAMLEPIGFSNFRREFLRGAPYALMVAEKR